MKEIKEEDYPAICKIINDSEFLLTQIIGTKVSLKIEFQEKILNQDELNTIALQQLTCSEFDISWKQMISPWRDRKVVDARKAYCYIASIILKYPVTKTAREIKKDHTSVMYLRNRCAELIEIGDPIKIKIENIKKALYENIN